eukprot:scaffold126_cov315-Pavlova_lutheri.AAC.37
MRGQEKSFGTSIYTSWSNERTHMLHMVISNAWSLEDPIDADVEKGALVSPTGEEIAMIHLDKGGVVGSEFEEKAARRNVH